MNIIKIIISFLILLLLATGVWYGLNQSVKQSGYEKIESVDTVFIDQNKMRLRVVFDPKLNLATIYFEEIQGIQLAQVESSSGVRYENEDLGLVFWNNGEEAQLYQYDELIFTNSKINEDEVGTDSENTTPGTRDIQAYQWIWKETQMNNGSVTIPRDKTAFSLAFAEDGNLSGTTDCNGFGGAYSLSQGEIIFGPFMQTLMYCEGSQESEFVQMVNKSGSYVFDDNDNLVFLIKPDLGLVFFEKGKAL